jgi:hypothetical protein
LAFAFSGVEASAVGPHALGIGQGGSVIGVSGAFFR